MENIEFEGKRIYYSYAPTKPEIIYYQQTAYFSFGLINFK